MTMVFAKQIFYPRELHDKLSVILAEEIGFTHRVSSMNEFIVKILAEYVDKHDGALSQQRRSVAVETIARAEKILKNGALNGAIVDHWLGVLGQYRLYSIDDELNAQLDALMARFKRKVK